MKRSLTMGVAVFLALALMGCSKANPQAINVSSNPPQVGETIDDVVLRLGTPGVNDFESLRKTARYITSYIDKDGTIHHITVEDGIITRVVYTGSR
ncbi:MAG: hypothetical protein AB8C95_11365 [Phycisphaeraceae bacterium]